jgi:Nucleotidyltransferase domain
VSTSQDGVRRAELERRIGEYHDKTVADVLEVISYLRDEGDRVIAGGSLALGLGNRLSDLDVLVAGDRTIDSSRVPLEHFVGSLRVDVWKLDRGLIEATFERAERALAAEGPLGGAFGDVDHETDLKLLHRVAFGILLDGPPFEPRSGHHYEAIARDLVVREYAERLRESALLAQLAVQAGGPIAAAINARLVVEEALHATIAARGLPFTGDKWLRERLAHGLPELESLYRPYAALPDRREQCAAFVAGALETAGALTGLDLSSDRLADGAAWRSRGLRAIAVGESHVLLSSRFGALWQLEGSEVAAWESLARTGTDDGNAAWPCDELDEDQTRLCFGLFERGLISLAWARGLPVSELAVVAREPRR